MSSTSYKRTDRLNDQLRERISELLLVAVKEPRVAGVTVTRVDAAPDLQNARVFYRALGVANGDKEKIDSIRIGLEKIEGMLRHALGKQLRMKKIPNLRFIFDAGLEDGLRVEKILHELKRTEEPTNG